MIPVGLVLSTAGGDRSFPRSRAIVVLQCFYPLGPTSLSEDLWARWPELWLPGRTTLLVVDRSDDAETLRSNTLTLELHLSKSRIPRLLALPRDPASSASARTVAVAWLARLHPLGPFIAAPTAEQLPSNAAALAAWETWWTASHDLPEVVAALAAPDPSRPSP